MGQRHSHEQRHSSFGSFVVTSTNTNPNEELDNYMYSINDSIGTISPPAVRIEFESFVSPMNNSSSSNQEQLVVYAAPAIQTQLSSRSKETIERLKEIKKEKSLLLSAVNPKSMTKLSDDLQQSDKKLLHQVNDLMKKKHQLRLIELEESVLLAQQDLLKTPRYSMTSPMDTEQDGQKRATKNIKGLWRDAVRALKTPTTSSTTTDGETRSSFVRRLSSRKKKSHHERQEDPTVIDPVYETLKVAAETRKRTIATYLQQRQQTLNKQTSLNSQGSSEVEIQPSPRILRHPTPVDPSPQMRRQNTRTESNLSRTASDNARVPN